MTADNKEPVADALGMLGSAYRGDWSDVDGRTLRDQLGELAVHLTSDEPFDAALWAANNNVCPEARSWVEHCDERGQHGTYSCAHVESIHERHIAERGGAS